MVVLVVCGEHASTFQGWEGEETKIDPEGWIKVHGLLASYGEHVLLRQVQGLGSRVEGVGCRVQGVG